MKNAIISLVLAAAAVSHLGAAPHAYRGEITEAITFTSGSPYSIGETFHGYYEYTSDSINGTFYTGDPTLLPNGVNESLTGSFYLPWYASAYGVDQDGNPVWVSEGLAGQYQGFGTRNSGDLQVSGGHFTGFDWSWELGAYYATAGAGAGGGGIYALSMYDQAPTEANASLVFGNPIQIPDRGATITLMTLGLLLIIYAWRRGRGFQDEI
ncbi:MAG TPA: hypothetical protein VGL42_04635 [Opitutaceae bacterium]|jgi:hypothetical protein